MAKGKRSPPSPPNYCINSGLPTRLRFVGGELCGMLVRDSTECLTTGGIIPFMAHGRDGWPVRFLDKCKSVGESKAEEIR